MAGMFPPISQRYVISSTSWIAELVCKYQQNNNAKIEPRDICNWLLIERVLLVSGMAKTINVMAPRRLKSQSTLGELEQYPLYKKDNQNGFLSTIIVWLQLASKGSSVYDEPELGSSNSPENATIVSLTCTSLAPCATFTLTPSCIKEVANLPASGAQNQPPVPATECREDCNIWRRLTGTCCGVGGSMCNPVVVPSGAELPFTVPLSGVEFTIPVTVGTHTYPASTPLPTDAHLGDDDDDDDDDDHDIWFPIPFIIPIPIPLPLDPPLPPPPVNCESSGICCTPDVSDALGFCSNGNYPLWDNVKNIIGCTVGNLADALSLRSSCQITLDDSPIEAAEAIEDARTCRLPESNTCGASPFGLKAQDSSEELQRIQKRDRVFGTKWKACDFSTQPAFPWAVTGDYHAVYTCKGSADYFPNICGNLRTTEDWYGARPENAGAALGETGGWRIAGCNIEEYPFWSVNALPAPARGHPVLRLVGQTVPSKSENSQYASDWDQFLVAVDRYYFKSYRSGTVMTTRLDSAGYTTAAGAPPGVMPRSSLTFKITWDTDTPGEHDELTLQFCDWSSPGTLSIRQGILPQSREITYAAAQGPPGGTIPPYPPSVNWAWEQTTFVGDGGTTTMLKEVPTSCRPWPLASLVVPSEPATYRITSNMNDLPVWSNLATRDLGAKRNVDPEPGVFGPNEGPDETMNPNPQDVLRTVYRKNLQVRRRRARRESRPADRDGDEIPNEKVSNNSSPGILSPLNGADEGYDPCYMNSRCLDKLPSPSSSDTFPPGGNNGGGGGNPNIGRSWILLWEGLCDNLGVCAQTYWRGQDWTKTPPSIGDIADACETESQQTRETPGRTDGLFPDSLSGVRHYGQICSYKGNGNQQLEPGLEVGTLTCGRFNAKCTALRPREEQICFWGQILALATCVWV
ncbi:hypothetical protein TWF132_001568 [Orbilia oligospora]|nr:hypothetical protein TWF132_001568 [Orbilia oligospora]